MSVIVKKYEITIAVVDAVADSQDVAYVTIQDLNLPSSRPTIFKQEINWKMGDPASLPEFTAAQVQSLVTRALVEGGIAPEVLGARDPGGNGLMLL